MSRVLNVYFKGNRLVIFSAECKKTLALVLLNILFPVICGYGWPGVDKTRNVEHS